LSGQANIAPLAVADNLQARAGKVLVVGPANGVLKNDSDANGDVLGARLISGPAHGKLKLNGNGSFSYLPAPGFTGIDQFSYLANDDLLDSQPALVTINVK
jgi:titin